MEAPQITSPPECGSQCNGNASASGHNPDNWNISYHNDKPGHLTKKAQIIAQIFAMQEKVLNFPKLLPQKNLQKIAGQKKR